MQSAAQEKGFKQIPQITNAFSSNAPFTRLQVGQNEKAICFINFSATRNNKVDLVDNWKTLQTYNAAESKDIQIALANGLYLLKATSNGDEKAIIVSPSKIEIYVEF